MSLKLRQKLIRQIEAARKSHVITYVTSTRQNLEVQMAMDAIRRVYDHLVSLPGAKPVERVDLFLHSNGGDGIVPWRLVTLIREYAKEFNVLVPHRAFSAATLTALGADNIVMHPMGMLGPTDPTVANLFNPQDPTNPQRRLGISVEDVTAYLALIKEDAGIQHEDQVVLAFNHLAAHVHPLALGNVKRSLSQSRMMARKLLGLHMDTVKDAHKIDEIVDNLTSKLFYHGHAINRREAKEQLGLARVQYPPPKVESAMWRLQHEYETEMKLEEPFNHPSEFLAVFPNLAPGEQKVTPAAVAKLAFIESAFRTDVFSLEYELAGQKAANGATTVTLIERHGGWQVENEESRKTRKKGLHRLRAAT